MKHTTSAEGDGATRPAFSPQGELVATHYERLRLLAKRLLGSPSTGAIEATDVVHECYLRLERLEGFRDLGHAAFLSLAARTIRHVLVELARKRGALKRGGNLHRVTLRAALDVEGRPEVDLLDLEDALERLVALHPRQAQVVELRFFGGLSLEETAEVLGIEKREAQMDWTMARAWLLDQLG
jgi:RNA polymerase sigma-70 factor, ECF subfamily